MILVLVGAGFTDGDLVLDWLGNPASEVVINCDKLTYADKLVTF